MAASAVRGGDEDKALDPPAGQFPGAGFNLNIQSDGKTRYYRSHKAENGVDVIDTWGIIEDAVDVTLQPQPIDTPSIFAVKWLHATIQTHGLPSLCQWIFPFAFKPSNPTEEAQLKTATTPLTFKLYKGMDPDFIREMVKSKLWMYAPAKDWPRYVTDPQNNVYPFTLLGTHPELFKNQGIDPETGKARVVFKLAFAPLWNRYYWNWGWKYLYIQTVDNAHSVFSRFVDWCNTHWLAVPVVAIAMFLVVAESLGLFVAFVGIEDWVFSVLWTWIGRFQVVFFELFVRPLRNIYRNGSVIETPVGTFGFWQGKDDADICAAIIPGVDSEKWKGQGLSHQCTDIITKKEDAFVSSVGFTFAAMLLYLTYHNLFNPKKR